MLRAVGPWSNTLGYIISISIEQYGLCWSEVVVEIDGGLI